MVHKNTALLTFNTSKHCVLQAEGKVYDTTQPYRDTAEWKMKTTDLISNTRKVDYQTDKQLQLHTFFFIDYQVLDHWPYHQLFMIVVLKNPTIRFVSPPLCSDLIHYVHNRWLIIIIASSSSSLPTFGTFGKDQSPIVALDNMTNPNNHWYWV